MEAPQERSVTHKKKENATWMRKVIIHNERKWHCLPLNSLFSVQGMIFFKQLLGRIFDHIFFLLLEPRWGTDGSVTRWLRSRLIGEVLGGGPGAQVWSLMQFCYFTMCKIANFVRNMRVKTLIWSLSSWDPWGNGLHLATVGSNNCPLTGPRKKMTSDLRRVKGNAGKINHWPYLLLHYLTRYPRRSRCIPRVMTLKSA